MIMTLTEAGALRERLIALAFEHCGDLGRTGVRKDVEGDWAAAGRTPRGRTLRGRALEFAETMLLRSTASQPRRRAYRARVAEAADLWTSNLSKMEEACDPDRS